MKDILGHKQYYHFPLHGLFITTKEVCIDMRTTTTYPIKHNRNKPFDKISGQMIASDILLIFQQRRIELFDGQVTILNGG